MASSLAGQRDTACSPMGGDQLGGRQVGRQIGRQIGRVKI